MNKYFKYIEKLASKNQIRKEKFNSLSYKEKVQYLKDNFQLLGTGSSRITFLINSGKVIKLARNDAGVAQNKVEFDNLLKYKSKFIPKAFDRSPDSVWIETEFVRPVKNFSEFCRYFKIKESLMEKLFLMLRTFRSMLEIKFKIKDLESKNELLSKDTDFDFSNKIKENKFNIYLLSFVIHRQDLNELYTFIYDNLVDSIGDFTAKNNIQNFGIINDQIKIIDLGFDEAVADIFYPMMESEKSIDPQENQDPVLIQNGKERQFIEYNTKDPHNKLKELKKKVWTRNPKNYNTQVTYKP